MSTIDGVMFFVVIASCIGLAAHGIRSIVLCECDAEDRSGADLLVISVWLGTTVAAFGLWALPLELWAKSAGIGLMMSLPVIAASIWVSVQAGDHS